MSLSKIEGSLLNLLALDDLDCLLKAIVHKNLALKNHEIPLGSFFLSLIVKPTWMFPKEVENPIGKRMLLKLRKNEYNKDHPLSGVSVSQFVVCEDEDTGGVGSLTEQVMCFLKFIFKGIINGDFNKINVLITDINSTIRSF